MRELGLFGATIPVEYGGLGLDYSTYASSSKSSAAAG
jgi:alkylation response protein AidB-like acyl-CoA dehydrogenase